MFINIETNSGQRMVINPEEIAFIEYNEKYKVLAVYLKCKPEYGIKIEGFTIDEFLSVLSGELDFFEHKYPVGKPEFEQPPVDVVKKVENANDVKPVWDKEQEKEKQERVKKRRTTW